MQYPLGLHPQDHTPPQGHSPAKCAAHILLECCLPSTNVFEGSLITLLFTSGFRLTPAIAVYGVRLLICDLAISVRVLRLSHNNSVDYI